MSLLSSSINNVRCLADEENDHNMLQDLQLAAELGKTLLERNKELENSLKSHQSTIEEQAQEIEYMKKQTAALKEVNNSRLKIYEQLEVSIQDLERANRRLVVENSSDKKLIKSQSLTIESLEAKSEELQKKIDDLKSLCENLQRQQMTNQQCEDESQLLTVSKASMSQDGSIKRIAAKTPLKPTLESQIDTCSRQLVNTHVEDEEVTELLRQLHESRNQRAREQARVIELTEQLAALVQENTSLEDQLNVWRNKAQDMKNLQDEINTLEEVRQGHLCGRCLRGVDLSTHDELSVMLDQEEDDDISMAESFVNDNQRDCESITQETSSKVGEADESDPNPYRVLVEKYEALLEVQRHPAIRRKPSAPTTCMSLQEELEMSGEFNNFQNSTCDYEMSQQDSKATNQNGGRRGFAKKPFSGTPTDFSEAETSSSGFADETSNKSTQTDERPGSFLCSIADGEDCKFSIYDDNSPFESRFRKTPEYRQLFSEIFRVLKRAAEAKEDGEKLPLLNNSSSNNTLKCDNNSGDSPQLDDCNSEATDDCQSVMSSVVSSVVSEPVFRVQTPELKRKNNETSSTTQETPKSSISTVSSLTNGKITGDSYHHPKTHQPRRHHLDYLSVNVQVRKKNNAKKNCTKKSTSIERSKTPDNSTSPRVPKSNSSGKRNKFRPLTTAEQADGTIWNGNTLHIFSSKTRISPGNSNNSTTLRSRQNSVSSTCNSTNDQHNSSLEYKEYKPSTASEEVARLRRLEMSYAEALRMPNKPKVHNNRRY